MENAPIDKEWPPLKECLQYKYGMINHYMKVFALESRDHVDDSEYNRVVESNEEEEEEDDDDGYYVKDAHQVALKFLQQVRESRGYDVDCTPPMMFYSPFRPVDLSWELRSIPHYNLAANFVIEKISERTQKTYKLVKIEKIVATKNRILLFTIKAKEEGASDDDAQTFHAMVYTPGSRHKFEVEELRIKPSGPAPWSCS